MTQVPYRSSIPTNVYFAGCRDGLRTGPAVVLQPQDPQAHLRPEGGGRRQMPYRRLQEQCLHRTGRH